MRQVQGVADKNTAKSSVCIGSAWGAGYLDCRIMLTEKVSPRALKLCTPSGRVQRIFTSRDVAVVDLIGEGVQIYTGGVTVTVRKYALTFRDGKFIVCTIPSGEYTKIFESAIYSE